MRVLVTGSGGFIGAALVRALAAHPGIERIDAVDLEPGEAGGCVHARAADLAEAGLARTLVNAETAAVFHLAALVSGGAERDFARGTRINLDATRELLEACRLAGHRPRFVFTSSVAVYGGERLDKVTDDTPPAPRLSYGAQKLVGEILINDYSRRGYVDGRTLRLPGVLVRPGGANSAVSGWSSAIIREPLAGRDYACPVRADTRLACTSVGRVVEALVQALEWPAGSLGAERSVLLNGPGVTAQAMWDAVRRAAGGRPIGRVTFRPDPDLQRLMDRAPRATVSARASGLGLRPGAGIDEIVADYLATAGADATA